MFIRVLGRVRVRSSGSGARRGYVNEGNEGLGQGEGMVIRVGPRSWYFPAGFGAGSRGVFDRERSGLGKNILTRFQTNYWTVIVVKSFSGC
jgi:hypothetical protein